MLALAAVALYFIRERGAGLVAVAEPALGRHAADAGPSASYLLLHLLIALAAVVGLGYLLGRLCVVIGQPPVMGEIVAGIALGPSILGAEWAARIVPSGVAPHLGLIAQVGVILYLFTVGLDMPVETLKHRAGATVAISHASIVVPFVSGAALALWAYPRFASHDVGFTPFALFLGTAMSITAFPVLARILADSKLARTPLGNLALACAAINDVTAWCLLAVVTGVARARAGAGLMVVAGTVVYLVVLMAVVRRLLATWLARRGGDEPARGTIALVFMGLLVSALATEAIGIHALFGAFLFGAVIPHDSGVARTLGKALEPPVGVLLLPAFFASTGLRTRIDLLDGTGPWLACGLVIVVATLGKFGGTWAAARLAGLGGRTAAALGALMNTRGLMELIVLNAGLELGVITPTVFSMLVLMALATTFATAPLLRMIRPDPAMAG
ncbi:MAG TPA: cation:proton antiporter [Candidatus Polarisedimenticolia bacterium]|nr:cation:proton antiporter [Candidatus Polarisedimenticolia bacterium]